MIFLLTLLGCPICFDEQPQERQASDGIKQEPEFFFNDEDGGILNGDEYVPPKVYPMSIYRK